MAENSSGSGRWLRIRRSIPTALGSTALAAGVTTALGELARFSGDLIRSVHAHVYATLATAGDRGPVASVGSGFGDAIHDTAAAVPVMAAGGVAGFLAPHAATARGVTLMTLGNFCLPIAGAFATQASLASPDDVAVVQRAVTGVSTGYLGGVATRLAYDRPADPPEGPDDGPGGGGPDDGPRGGGPDDGPPGPPSSGRPFGSIDAVVVNRLPADSRSRTSVSSAARRRAAGPTGGEARKPHP